MDNKKIPTGLGTIIIIILAITAGVIIFIFDKQFKTYESPKQKSEPFVSPIEKQQINNNQEYENIIVKNESESNKSGCILKRKNGNEYDIVFESETCYLPILKWKDLLIFSEGDGYSNEDVKLLFFNIKNGTKAVAYSLNEHTEDYKKKPYEVRPMNIFEDTLYFNAGSYMTDQLIYSVNLNKKDLVPKLISVDTGYSQIELDDGHYWISGGFGDAGFSSSKRALFDLDSQKIIGQEILTSSNMGVGTKYLGADEKNAFIASFIENPKQKTEDDKLNPILSEIYALNLNHNNGSKVILSKDRAPAGIKRTFYINDKNSIVLLGDDAYTYDLENNQMEKIVSLAGQNLSGPDKSFANRVCLSEHSSLDLKKKIIISDEKNCEWDNGLDKLNNDIKSFNLPDNYVYLSNGQELIN